METNEYFGDLTIRSVFDKRFNSSFPHDVRISCKPGVFSIEMIVEGEVRLQKDGRCIPLKAPVIFWLGDQDKYFCYQYIGTPYRHLWIDFVGSRGRRIYTALKSKFPKGKISLPKRIFPPFSGSSPRSTMTSTAPAAIIRTP